MQGTVMGGPPRVVGITADGALDGSRVLAASLAAAMATAGIRVLLAGVDPERQEPAGVDVESGGGALVRLALPAGEAESRAAVLAAIEEAGRAADRVVLDLGDIRTDAATFFGAAVDDLVLAVGASAEETRRAGAYVARLARRWDREDVLLVVVGSRAPEAAGVVLREIASAAGAAAPRLVPLGVVPSPSGGAALEAIAARLLEPRPAPLRGGVQFFLEERLGTGRAE